MIADGFFMLLVYLGMVQFLEVPIIQIFLWLFGAFILIYTGVENIININSITLAGTRGKDSLFKCFFTGFIMSITSPLSILFWLGIYGSVLAKTAQTNGTEQLLIYSSMIFLGLTPAPTPLLVPAVRAAQVVTVFDLHFLHAPGEVPGPAPELVRDHVHRADHVIAGSAYAAGLVGNELGVPAARITTTPLGAPRWAAEVRAAHRTTPGSAFLFVGTLEPRKNLGVLLDAYTRLVTERPDAPALLLAGRPTPAAQPWLARLDKPPLAGRAHVLGYVDDATRRRLYREARALVLPSLDEGFGLPALEGLACGVPVVASAAESLPEVVGDAGTLVNPRDADAWTRALASLLDDRTAQAWPAAARRGRRPSPGTRPRRRRDAPTTRPWPPAGSGLRCGSRSTPVSWPDVRPASAAIWLSCWTSGQTARGGRTNSCSTAIGRPRPPGRAGRCASCLVRAAHGGSSGSSPGPSAAIALTCCSHPDTRRRSPARPRWRWRSTTSPISPIQSGTPLAKACDGVKSPPGPHAGPTSCWRRRPSQAAESCASPECSKAGSG